MNKNLLVICAILALILPIQADWTLQEQHNITSSSAWQQRVEMAFMKIAHDVTNEDAQTANHENRLLLAQQVIDGSGVPSRAFKLLHFRNPALQASPDPTDSDILFTVSQQWDYFANRLAAQQAQ